MDDRRPRQILASFVAALAMVVPLAVMCIMEINTDPTVLSSGEVDDAGLRGAAVTLMALPFIYMICVALCHVSGYFLLRFGFRMLRHFIVYALAASIALGLLAMFALGSSPQIELTDIAVLFLTVALFLGAIGSVGAAIWWWVAVKPYNSSLPADPQAGQ